MESLALICFSLAINSLSAKSGKDCRADVKSLLVAVVELVVAALL